MESNYYERCYIAFYWTLEHIFMQTKQPVAPHPFSLCDLLSDMCPFTFETGMSADPAAFYDYEKILKKIVASQEMESVFDGYRAGREFMQMYMAEYEYALEDVLPAFSLEDYTFAYDKAGERNHPEL